MHPSSWCCEEEEAGRVWALMLSCQRDRCVYTERHFAIALRLTAGSARQKAIETSSAPYVLCLGKELEEVVGGGGKWGHAERCEWVCDVVHYPRPTPTRPTRTLSLSLSPPALSCAESLAGRLPVVHLCRVAVAARRASSVGFSLFQPSPSAVLASSQVGWVCRGWDHFMRRAPS